MEKAIKLKVMKWITQQLQKGKTDFDIIDCTQDIGLDPFNSNDIQMVDDVFQWNTDQLDNYFLRTVDKNT